MKLDVVVVGAGFGGLYMLHHLRTLGFTARTFEAASGVGGTWYWNRYPGARCDVESLEYSYSFSDELQQQWRWRDRYAAQPDILNYLNHVADRFDLRRDIAFDTRVTAARFDDASNRWHVHTDRGDDVEARFCIMATGCLSTPKLPELPGIDDFRGRRFHTGRWPHEAADFTSRAVGVIGTGSTGIQLIPKIAAQARQVIVFQRTPNFSLPAFNRPLDEEAEARVKADYASVRQRARQSPTGVAGFPIPDKSVLEVSDEERERIFEFRWNVGSTGFTRSFNDIATNKAANDLTADFVRRKIASKVRDPATAQLLSPRDHCIGTKRICLDTNYYETYNRDNVRVVDLRATPIARIDASGARTSDAHYALDDLVFATGFDAMTGALLNIDIVGANGRSLAQKWTAGPRTCLGLMSAGFPNLFMITGPGSPSVLSNMVTSIEQHVEWIGDCLAHLRARDVATIDASVRAEDEWVAHVNAVASQTLFPTAKSWYMGANVPGKPRIFMPYIGGVGVYRNKCDEVAAQEYSGFVLGPATGAQT